MSVLLAGILLVIGLGTLFVAPWVGGGFIALALLIGVGSVLWTATHGVTVDDSPTESPHLPGPGNPQSGVD